MKIAFVTNNYTPYKGGVVSSINFFKKALEKIGHKVYIVTLDFYNNPKNEPFDIIRIKSDIKFTFKDGPIGIPIRLDKEVLETLKDLNPDIIHSHHPFFIGVSALKAAQKLKKKIVFTHHTFYHDYAHKFPFPEPISIPIIKKLDFNYCNKVDHIIAPSNQTKSFLEKNKVKNKISVLPTGIDPVFFNESKKYNLDKKIKLIHVGRFEKEKNIPFLIKMFSKLDKKKFEFTLVGFGSELENLKKLDDKLKTNINFVVDPKKEALINEYHNSDVFIFSSQSDTQAIVLAEAMASGLPVISLDGAGQRDIVEQDINGSIVKNEKEFLEKLIFLEKNREFLTNWSSQAQKKAENYLEENLVKNLEKIYQSLIQPWNFGVVIRNYILFYKKTIFFIIFIWK